MAKQPQLTQALLCKEASNFAKAQSIVPIPALYGVTDGKAVGTHVEHAFTAHLSRLFRFTPCNSAEGVDFQDIPADMKVTSVKQPQSSSPFKSARQKIYGLGYGVLVFVYEKSDDPNTATALLKIVHTIYIEKERTADFTMTRLILEHLKVNADVDDLVALMRDKNLPVDFEVEAPTLAEEIIKKPPREGYLTISNALQWRLQYNHAIKHAGTAPGIQRL
jgi:hypothetical protein